MRIPHLFQILHNYNKIINESNLDEFIKFAKDWNIFKNVDSNFHKIISDKIRERLKKENLSENAVKPEINNV